MFLTDTQIQALGFKKVGTNVLISDKASIYNAENISIGNNVRIDDFAILSAGVGGIEIGSNIHIACHASFIGAGKITLGDYSNYAAYTCILSSSDDFTGEYLISPVLPDEFRKVKSADVTIKDFVVLGIRTTVLPGVTMGKNSGTGAMTLIKKDVPENELWIGCPATRLMNRMKNKFGIESESEANWTERYLEHINHID